MALMVSGGSRFPGDRRSTRLWPRRAGAWAVGALLWMLAAATCLWPAAAGAQQERCYPGPPLYILRELMHGEDTPERYREAVLTYAHEHCRNGQTLKLVGPVGPGEAQDLLNGEVALELCYPETIYRERLARGEKAVVLFCLVEKLSQ